MRSASFHPNDPVLACGLFQGGVVFLRGASHATLFVNWEMEPKRYSYDRTVLSVQWNVSKKNNNNNGRKKMLYTAEYLLTKSEALKNLNVTKKI